MPDAGRGPSGEFPETWWTLIGEALADGTTLRTAALDELVVRYQPPLRAYLVFRKRLDQELAEELLQAFVTEKFVAQYLLRHADRSKGKFRSLLVRSLDNYYADWGRARAMGAQTGMAAILDEVAAAQPAEMDIFDIAWARQLLNEVLTMMRSDCAADGQEGVWGVFECRLLAPIYQTSAPVSYEEVCRRFGFMSPEQASNALMTAKRKFRRAFDRIAARYQHDGEKSEDVLRELTGILSQAGPLEWHEVSTAMVSARGADQATHGDLEDSQPSLVARLLAVSPNTDDLWLPEDLRGLLRHQLAQPMTRFDLKVAAKAPPAKGSEGEVASLTTLGDLFSHPAPPLELLEAVKRYGRKHAHGAEATLPDEIASAVYFASIAAAMVRHGERISKSADELLRWGFVRLLDRPWIESPLRELFEVGLARLS